MKDHFFKNITIEITNGNKNRYNAVLDVCRQNDVAFEEITDKGEIKVLAYFTPNEVEKFFNDVDKREEQLKNIPNVSLTEEQKAVVDKVMNMLSDANIGMCHDYLSTGELGFFNSINGKLYACDDIEKYGDVFFDKDTIKGSLYIINSKRKGKHIYSFYSNGGFVMEK